MLERRLYRRIWSELAQEKPMIFIAGPRQTGKTTLARMVADEAFKNQVYFNWDIIEDKKRLIEQPAFFENVNRLDSSVPLVIFDEIHKYRKWKNYLKGVYDRFAGQYKFLVLGSGRLNVFQKGGDSLAGRYLLFSLWPLTLAELADRPRSFKEFMRNPLFVPDFRNEDEKTWNSLSTLSGFPEPFVSGKETSYRRWSNTYHQQLIREDIRNMTEIKDIDHAEILFSLLPSKVGAPLSMDSLARDLQVSFNSVRNWLDVFDSFFLTFRLSPWSKKISRAISKGRKPYLFDYGGISSLAAKYENMVALELLRAVSNWNDLGLGRFSLHYVRNKEQEEVDFLIANNNTPMLIIETKLEDEQVSKSLLKFQSFLNIPAIQLVNKAGVYKVMKNSQHQTLVVSAPRWLSALP